MRSVRKHRALPHTVCACERFATGPERKYLGGRAHLVGERRREGRGGERERESESTKLKCTFCSAAAFCFGRAACEVVARGCSKVLELARNSG